MADPKPTLLTSLDFADVRREIVAQFLKNDRFKDARFEQSGIGYLTDVHAHIAQYLGFMGHAIFNEWDPATAQLRMSLVVAAKNQNYYPRRRSAAIGVVTVSISDFTPVYAKYPSFDIVNDTLLLPKYAIFDTEDGRSFITTEDHLLTQDNNFSKTFTIIEGARIEDRVIGTSNGTPNQSFEINVQTLAEQELIVYVDGEPWFNEQDLTEYTPSSMFYQVLENYKGNYEVRFGDGQLGEVPSDGAEIKVDYLESSGEDGNLQKGFKVISSLYINGLIDGVHEIGNNAFRTTTVEVSHSGAFRESITEIANNYPRYYAAQKRATTIADYDVIARRHPAIEYLSAYAGDEVNPPAYGFNFFTIKPKGGELLTPTQEADIRSYLEPFMIGGFELRFRPPLYMFVAVDATLVHTSYTTSSDVEAHARTTIINHFNALAATGDCFLYSRTLELLDNIDQVTNSHLNIETYLKVSPTLDGTYVYDLGQAILPGTLNFDVDTDVGWYDKDGIIYDKANNQELGTVDYDIGYIDVVGYTLIPGEYKLKFDLETKDAMVYQNLLIRLDEVSSSFTGRLSRKRNRR